MQKRATLSAMIGLGCGLVALAAVAADAAPQGPLAALGAAENAAAQAAARTTAVDQAIVPVAPSDPANPAPAGPDASAAEANDAEGEDLAIPASPRYDPARHRDPFRPPTITSTVADGGPRTPLERYEIGQLKLVGVVWEEEDARAMVEDSSGLGYIVTTGTPIGSSGGVVRSIEPRRVLIEEKTTNFYGEVQPREIVMELPQEDRSP